MMEETWNQFTNTGKVTDYLNYRGVDYSSSGRENDARGATEYGTKSCADRDGYVGNAHRGI